MHDVALIFYKYQNWKT